MERVRKFGIRACSELGIGHDVWWAFRSGGIRTWGRNPAIKTNRLVNCLQCFDTVNFASEEHPVYERMSGEVLEWLSVWSEVQMIYIWSSWCHCHPIINFIKVQIGKEAIKQVSVAPSSIALYVRTWYCTQSMFWRTLRTDCRAIPSVTNVSCSKVVSHNEDVCRYSQYITVSGYYDYTVHRHVDGSGDYFTDCRRRVGSRE